MDLRSGLKKETQSLHDQVESLPFFKKIIDQTITLQEYKQLLEKMYGFIAPYEAISCLVFQSLMEGRIKVPLLEEDLISLGIPKNAMQTIPQCCPFTKMTRENLFGYLYVIEGSTLGGQVITQLLKNHLHLSPANGARYFYGYGKKTREKWNEYCAQLNHIDDRMQQESIIQSALFTYRAFHAWLL